MTLLEDFEELNLLVPDAPTLTAGVHEEARTFGQEAAGLVLDVAGWRSEAADLADRLESALALLEEDAKLMRTSIESAIAIVLEAFATALAELAQKRGELATAAEEAEEAIRAAATGASSAAAFVSEACDEAATSASQQFAEFETQREALQNAMVVSSYLPLLDTAAQGASVAARESAATIARQLRRLGPLAKGHLTDAEKAVQIHMGGLSEDIDQVVESYASAASEMAEDLFDALDAAIIEVSMEADAADAAARSASATISGDVERLGRQGADFVTGQQGLEGKRDALVPYIEAAYRAQVQLDGER